MTDIEAHGPIDYVLIEFPGDQLKGECAAELLTLVDKGIIRLYDVALIVKEADGTFSGLTLQDVGPDALGGFAAFAGASSGLIGDEDLAAAAEALEVGTVAALIVYENAWAGPFVAAARRAGGELVASARIPAADVLAALEELDA